MNTRLSIRDAQQEALGFVISQTTYIEPQVYEIKYPAIQYRFLTPIDTAANPWAKSVTYFSSDKVGAAGFLNHLAKDIPRADVAREKHEVGVVLSGIGYGYTLEEINQAMMLNMNLPMEKAASARLASEQFIESKALWGDTEMNWTGLLNSDSLVTYGDVAANGSGSSSAWADKTGAQIADDINGLVGDIYSDTKQIELADTILLPPTSLSLIAGKQIASTGNMTVLDFVKQSNVYTATTGQPLTIRACRGLETAGDGGTGRMVAYRRAPDVVKLHVPMPFQFLPVWQDGPMSYVVPGIFRLAGLDIRLPKAIRYGDAIIDAAS